MARDRRSGPNSGGTLILHDAGQTSINTDSQACHDGVLPAGCSEADTEVEYSTSGLYVAQIRVYAALPPQSSPRLLAVSFGIDYDVNQVDFLLWGPCGDFAGDDDDWP